MAQLDNNDNTSINIREVQEKPGKEIILVFDNYEILLDNRCLGWGTGVCNRCKLKFRCHTSDALRIDFKEDIVKTPLPPERLTISEITQIYLSNQGVDSKLTGIYGG